MKLLISTLSLLVTVSSGFAEDFATSFYEAFRNENGRALEQLLHIEGASEFQVDQKIGFWEEQWTFMNQQGTHIEKPTLLTIEEFQTNEPSIAEYLTNQWNEKKVMNGRNYRLNLTVIATLAVTITNDSTNTSTSYYPLGLDQEGKYRIPLLKKD